MFLNKTSNDDIIILLDRQWVGKGHPLQDVTYALTTSLGANMLNKLRDFVDHYVECLTSHINCQNKVIISKELRFEFHWIWVDYARVIVTGLWKNLDPEKMKKYQKTVDPE